LIGMSVSFVPLFTVLLSIPLLRIYPTQRQAIGVLGALLCLIGILLDSQDRAIPVSDLLLAGSVPLGYALANICIRRRLMHISSLDLSFWSLVWTAACLVPSLMIDITPQPKASVPIWWPLTAVILLGTVGTGLANWMFNRLILQQGPLFAGMVTNLVPLGAVIWGWADHEQVTPLQVASLLGTMSMVALVQYGAAKPVADPEVV
jgi:drug/metabolite transporter (DMT)-like permease